jgi:hypothetical protein
MSLSNNEKSMFRHARKVKGWFNRNRWVKLPIVLLSLFFLWVAPLVTDRYMVCAF